MSSRRASTIAGRRTTRSSTKNNVNEEKPAQDRLQDAMRDDNVPDYIRLVFELLVQTREEIKELNRRNGDLLTELQKLREENSTLKEIINNSPPVSSETNLVENNSLPGNNFNTPSPEPDSELKRSIVLSNIPESPSSSAAAKIAHDCTCVRQILDFLDVECMPTAVYRMGKPGQSRPRLVKVVLPTSRFQSEAVKRAPRLRFFPPQKGIYLRPSLSKEERERRREDRLTRWGRGDDPVRTPSVRRGSPPHSPHPNLGDTTLASEPNSPSGNC